MKLLDTIIIPYTIITDPNTNASCTVMRMENKYELGGSTIMRRIRFYGDGIKINNHIYTYVSPICDTVTEVEDRFLKDLPDFLNWYNSGIHTTRATYCDENHPEE